MEISQIKREKDIVAVISSYQPVKKVGNELVTKCLWHNDKNPSLKIFPDTQRCYCYVCQESKKGWDVIDFVQQAEGIDTAAAIRRLSESIYQVPDTIQVAANKGLSSSSTRITSRPPADAGVPDFTTKAYGSAVAVYPITDADGYVLGWEVRYEVEDKKVIRVWSWGAPEGQRQKWAMGVFSGERPLFGLDQLRDMPQATVLITEGPKKAVAARQLLPEYVCLAWTNGSGSWHKHDWSHVKGRSILIWPDADDPGDKAAQQLAQLFCSDAFGCPSVKVIEGLETMPKGWDLADALQEGWDTEKTVAFARPRVREKMVDKTKAPPEVSTSQEEEQKAAQTPAYEESSEEVVIPLAPEHIPAAMSKEYLPEFMSEDYMALRFSEREAKNWRYVSQWGQWFRFKKNQWHRVERAEITEAAQMLTREARYWEEARDLSPSSRKALGLSRTFGNVRDIFSIHRHVRSTPDQWDQDDYLLGTPEGVIDLKTGEMAVKSRDSLISLQTRVAPQKGEHPVWTKFLNRCTDNNQDMIDYLQRWAGYMLTGSTREQAFAFLYGRGQNGKGVFITTFAEILGSYAAKVSDETLMAHDHAQHTQEIAKLVGVRYAYVDETDGGKKWNEARIKELTGGTKVAARFMARNDFEFMPRFKIIIAGNHKPQLRSVGKAMERRMHIIPFTVDITDEEKDFALQDKLAKEYPQILAWALEGCKKWQETGLARIESVREATSDYLEGEDTLGGWLDERTTQRGAVNPTILYKDYCAWSDHEGHTAWGRRAWANAMTDRGIQKSKAGGLILYVGVSLKEETKPKGVDWMD